MKLRSKKGYTLVELVILIAVLGVAAVITTTSLSYAFDDGSKEAYEQEINFILNRAEAYGESVIEDVKDSASGITVSVEKLVEKGFILADEKGHVTDPTNEKNILNDIKIKITYNASNDTVKAVVVS